MKRNNKIGTKSTSLTDHERYFAEIIIANYNYLKEEDFVFAELMLRTMGQQLIDEKVLESLDKITFDKEEKTVTIEYTLCDGDVGVYLPNPNRALKFSWKNLHEDLIKSRPFSKEQK